MVAPNLNRHVWLGSNGTIAHGWECNGIGGYSLRLVEQVFEATNSGRGKTCLPIDAGKGSVVEGERADRDATGLFLTTPPNQSTMRTNRGFRRCKRDSFGRYDAEGKSNCKAEAWRCRGGGACILIELLVTVGVKTSEIQCTTGKFTHHSRGGYRYRCTRWSIHSVLANNTQTAVPAPLLWNRSERSNSLAAVAAAMPR